MPNGNGTPHDSNPFITIELIPGALVGQPDRIQIQHKNCHGKWPQVVQLLVKAIDVAVLPKLFEQVAASEPRIVGIQQLPHERN